MIPGRKKVPKRKEFQKGLTCDRPGCDGDGVFTWRLPCSVGNLYVVVCAPCDLYLNRKSLEMFGLAEDKIEEICSTYAATQYASLWD